MCLWYTKKNTFWKCTDQQEISGVLTQGKLFILLGLNIEGNKNMEMSTERKQKSTKWNWNDVLACMSVQTHTTFFSLWNIKEAEQKTLYFIIFQEAYWNLGHYL